MVGQLGVGPVGPVQPLLGWPLDDPTADLAGHLGRDCRGLPLGLARSEAIEAPVQVGVEPSLDGPGGDAEVSGDVLMGSAPMGQPDDLKAVVELTFGGLKEGLFEAVGLCLGQMDADHGRGSHLVESGYLLFLRTGQH